MPDKHFYITTPIYYVNAKPHLGTLYSTIIADAIARWHKILGEKVFFLTGTDEHGQKVHEKALSEGKAPQVFVDSMIPPFKEMWAKYNIEYDKFIRTTDPDHKAAVVFWINKLMAQGDIYKATYEGWYCTPCETFVNVGAEPVKDADGQFICPSCLRQLKELSEESYFFKLSAYQDRLLEFYSQHQEFITPKERLQEVLSFVRSGLRDLCLSRKTVKWGIPFPGDPSHTVYVWGDALNNYISAVGYGSAEGRKQFETWWPAAMHVMAKDIVRFHSVYWPAFLMAAGLALPKKLLVHGYILVDSQKMSKSKGNAIDPADLAVTYGVDQVRYYLLRQMPITQDGSFTFQDLTDRINSDLANSLGNLLNRSVALAHKYNLHQVNSPKVWHEQALQLQQKAVATFKAYSQALDDGMFHIALAELWRFVADVNAYFHAMQPWKLSADKALFEQVIGATCHALRSIGLMLWPVMPKKMEALLESIGAPLKIGHHYLNELATQDWGCSFTLTLSEPLFTRIELMNASQENTTNDVVLEKAPEIPCIGIEDLAKVDLMVGTIRACEPVEGSQKLLKSQVDFGVLGMRQVLSGIAEWFKPDDLIGKQALFVTNLKPRKMMGLDSQGMLLVAKNSAGMAIVTPSIPVDNGTKLS